MSARPRKKSEWFVVVVFRFLLRCCWSFDLTLGVVRSRTRKRIGARLGVVLSISIAAIVPLLLIPRRRGNSTLRRRTLRPNHLRQNTLTASPRMQLPLLPPLLLLNHSSPIHIRRRLPSNRQPSIQNWFLNSFHLHQRFPDDSSLPTTGSREHRCRWRLRSRREVVRS